jgi:hypothetical protein
MGHQGLSVGWPLPRRDFYELPGRYLAICTAGALDQQGRRHGTPCTVRPLRLALREQVEAQGGPGYIESGFPDFRAAYAFAYTLLLYAKAYKLARLPGNRMKLAIAVGDNRHSTIDSITPRHFLQTGAHSDVSAPLVQGNLDGIGNDTERTADTAVSDLPPDFRNGFVSSVFEGLRRRLRQDPPI